MITHRQIYDILLFSFLLGRVMFEDFTVRLHALSNELFFKYIGVCWEMVMGFAFQSSSQNNINSV